MAAKPVREYISAEYPLSTGQFELIDKQLQRVAILPRAHDVLVDDLEHEMVFDDIGGQVPIGIRYRDNRTYEGTVPEDLIITLYNDFGRQLLSSHLLTEGPGVVQAEIGFSKYVPRNTFSGSMLFLEEKNVLIKYEAELDDPEAFGEEFEAFARRIGMVELWRKQYSETAGQYVVRSVYADEPTGYAIEGFVHELTTGNL